MSNTDWARPGAKCMCIDGTRPRHVVIPGLPAIEDDGMFPVEGQVYTVETVTWYESTLPFIESFVGVHLMEINRPPGRTTGEVVPFRIDRFRPLVERQAERDVRLFAPLLDGELEKT